jgi:Ca2+-binding RTX toxin-like protein
MALQLDGRIMAGNDLLDADLRDLEIVSGAGGVFLYAATGQNGGVSVYRVGGAGGLASLSDIGYFAGAGIAMGTFDVVSLDGALRLFVNGTADGQLTGFGLKGNGDITGTVFSDLPGGGTETETAAALSSVSLTGGITALYMVDGDTGALAGYVSDGMGALTSRAGLNGASGAYALGAVAALETTIAGGISFLLAADATWGGVYSYRIDDTSGALTYTDSLGARDGLGIAAPSAMQTVQAGGATWVILAAAGSGSLSVMKLLPSGQLEPADHLLDTQATRFGGVTALEVIEVQDHVFVLAGGADDGLALFSLLPGGQLVHMQSLANFTGAGLRNVTSIKAVQVGNEIQIFVASQGDLGLSQFSLSLTDLGSVIESGSAGGAQVLGTGDGDLILGRGPLDHLMGQGGDDILVAGTTGGTLTGGAGADIFVLGPASGPTSGPVQISDFEPGVDRLDLTRLPMLRSAAQLELTTTGAGIDILYGALVIEILSFDGKPLKAVDLWPTGFDTPDRVPIPEGPVIRVTRGTPGDDILTLGSGRDTIRGLAGADRLDGGADNDRGFGGAGNDVLLGGAGRDRLKGGAGKDQIRGESGRDQLFGGTGEDGLFGGRKGDTLKGGAGADRLKGGAGADMLQGGKGWDALLGGDKGDTLLGGAGKDRLNGGAGDDSLTGGAGKDVFVFRSGTGKPHGDDRILDFTDGRDLIRINAPGVGYADLTLSSLGNGDTLIDTGFGTITLTGVSPGVLDAGDFLFS